MAGRPLRRARTVRSNPNRLVVPRDIKQLADAGDLYSQSVVLAFRDDFREYARTHADVTLTEDGLQFSSEVYKNPDFVALYRRGADRVDTWNEERGMGAGTKAYEVQSKLPRVSELEAALREEKSAVQDVITLGLMTKKDLAYTLHLRKVERLEAQISALKAKARNNPRPPAYAIAKPATVQLAKMAGEALRDKGMTLPAGDNFWYAWLLAALARGVVRNQTGDSFTAELADMTLRQIAALADSDPSFYDT